MDVATPLGLFLFFVVLYGTGTTAAMVIQSHQHRQLQERVRVLEAQVAAEKARAEIDRRILVGLREHLNVSAYWGRLPSLGELAHMGGSLTAGKWK